MSSTGESSSSVTSLLGFHGRLTLASWGGGDQLMDYAVREINVLLWLFLIVVTALLLQRIVALLRLWDKGRRIPGLPCSSFFGHSKLISASGSSDNLNDILSKSHEKYGSMIRLWLGPSQLLISVKDPKLIKEVLEKAEDKFPLTGRVFRLAFGHSTLFASSFEKVQQRRDLLASQLNGTLLERANAVSLKVVNCVMERIDSIMTKGLLDCRVLSQHMAFSVLGATLFGDTFLAWSSATAYEELLMLISKDACFWASFNIPPIWKRGFWRYRRLCRKLKCLTQDIVQQCKRNYKFFSHGDQLLNLKNDTDSGKQFADNLVFSSDHMMAGGLCLEEFNNQLNLREESCGNIMGIMFHGCLTTASLIGSILTRLVLHSEIQAQWPDRSNKQSSAEMCVAITSKIYSELVSEQTGFVEPDLNIRESKLLLATVYEAARLMPAGPLLQRCSIKHDLNLKTGITLPAGAILVVPVQLVQLDGSCWGADASKFNPYRFLSKSTGQELNGDDKDAYVENSFRDFRRKLPVLDDLKQNAAFLPFGSGTRACVGQQFSILAITSLLASLLQHDEIKLQPGSENDPKTTMNNCVLHLLPSPKIVLVKRNC